MRRGGFTMIELIFVIVILGILAAVAIPKLMATRDDAKISAVSQEIQSAIQEIPQYIAAKGRIDDLEKMSQVLKQLKDQGKAIINNTADPKTAIISTEDGQGGTDNCIELDVNKTTLQVKHLTSVNGAICKGVQARIAEGNFTIGGQSVTF